MTDRVAVGSLGVARDLHDFVNDGGAAGHRRLAGDILVGARPASSMISRRRTARCLRSATGCRRRSTPGTASAAAGTSSSANTRRSCSEIGYLQPEGPDFSVSDRERRPGDRRGRRAAARRAGDECALRAERRQCPLGQPLRRALRHRRHPRRRRRGARRGLQPGARQAGDRLARGVSSTRPRRSTARRGAMRPALAIAERQARRLGRRSAVASGSKRPGALRRLRRERGGARPPSCSAITACISKSSDRPRAIRSARAIRPASPTSWSKRR